MEHIESIRSLDSRLSSESARFRGNSSRTRDIRQNATPISFIMEKMSKLPKQCKSAPN